MVSHIALQTLRVAGRPPSLRPQWPSEHVLGRELELILRRLLIGNPERDLPPILIQP